MKQLDRKMVGLGHFIDTTRRQMHISIEHLCAEALCSKSTYRSI